MLVDKNNLFDKILVEAPILNEEMTFPHFVEIVCERFKNEHVSLVVTTIWISNNNNIIPVELPLIINKMKTDYLKYIEEAKKAIPHIRAYSNDPNYKSIASEYLSDWLLDFAINDSEQEQIKSNDSNIVKHNPEGIEVAKSLKRRIKREVRKGFIY